MILRPNLRVSSPPSIFSPARPGPFICQSCRNARLLKRPKRPYTFTQLITLSDGSAFTVRTTSPVPVYRSTKDMRNTLLWNPSSRDLMNVEEDDAGRLAAFRARFGRAYDTTKPPSAVEEVVPESTEGVSESTGGAPKPDAFGATEDIGMDDNGFAEEEDQSILELIGSFGRRGKSSKLPKTKSKTPDQPQAGDAKKGGRK